MEEGADAMVDGDVAFESGTARAAFAHRDFRVLFFGAFASNIGTWMQNVVLTAFAYELTRSAAFVGLIVFAQLGPLLLLSIVGGVLADVLDRRKLLMAVAAQQMAFSVVLAWLTRVDDPSRVGILLAVLAIGIGQAMHAPAYNAVLPMLVGRRDLAGAIALNSTQMNASRVVGPAIGGLAFSALGPSVVFLVNAATYPFVILALATITLPPVMASGDEHGLRRVVAGFRVARRDPLVRRCLIVITTFSFWCLAFIGQMPVLADRNLGIDPRSTGYGLLYAAFGFGAVVGAISVGTVFAQRSKPRLVRLGLAAFAVALATLALMRRPVPAYAVIMALGFCYFATVTSLSTVLQQHLDDAVRGRVMALWIMGFGGTVPIGNLVAGPVIGLTSITTVMLVGAAVALLLSWRGELISVAAASSAGRR